MAGLIWRLEDARGFGIYSLDVGAHESGANRYQHPAPGYDDVTPRMLTNRFDIMLNRYVERRATLLDMTTPEHLYGFESIQQAQTWFDEPQMASRWEKHKIYLTAYRREDCRDVHVSHRQAIFIPPECRLQRRAVFRPREMFQLPTDTIESWGRSAVEQKEKLYQSVRGFRSRAGEIVMFIAGTGGESQLAAA